MVPGGEPNSERWSTQDKFLIVVETASHNEIEMAEYWRSKGLYVEQVHAWRDACMQANGGITEQASRLQKELRNKEKDVKKLEQEFRSLPPSQIVPILADRDIYMASESTIYRVLKQQNMQHHRGRSHKPSSKPISTHSANGPNQVWMWDITWLPGPAKGIYFFLYLILDLYSRKIIVKTASIFK